MERKRLREIIYEKSYREGEFTLSSGKKSLYYFDLKQTTLNGEGVYLIVKLFFALLPEDIKAVGGLTMGADPLSSGLSLFSFMQGRKVHAFYVRKEPKPHGTSKWIEGTENLSRGDKVYILEDVVTTGASGMRAVEAAREAGLVVKGVLAVVDREEGGGEVFMKNGLELKALFSRTEITQGI